MNSTVSWVVTLCILERARRFGGTQSLYLQGRKVTKKPAGCKLSRVVRREHKIPEVNHAVEMSSDVEIYVPSFMKIVSGIQKLIGGIHRQQGDPISLLLLFQSEESKLKTDLKELLWKDVEWIHLAQGRDQWRALLNIV
jgi:hypothetical protein